MSHDPDKISRPLFGSFVLRYEYLLHVVKNNHLTHEPYDILLPRISVESRGLPYLVLTIRHSQWLTYVVHLQNNSPSRLDLYN